jgi:hypothetical protein
MALTRVAFNYFPHQFKPVRFQVLTVTSMKMTVFMSPEIIFEISVSYCVEYEGMLRPVLAQTYSFIKAYSLYQQSHKTTRHSIPQKAHPGLALFTFVSTAWHHVSDRRPPTALSSIPQIMSMGSLGGIMTRKNRRTRRKYLSQYHFVHHDFHMDWPGCEHGPPRWTRVILLLRFNLGFDHKETTESHSDISRSPRSEKYTQPCVM